MANKDKSLEDIKSGKGLKPIPTQSTSTQSGLTTEQRSQDSGLRKDTFTRQEPTETSGNKNGQ